MSMGGASCIVVTAQGKQSELVCAIQQFFV
jgi:hypothetical protein